MKFFFIILIIALTSCQEKWVDKSGSNTIIFNKEKVKTHFSAVDNYGNSYYKEGSYTISKKIPNDRNKAFNLYILEEDSTHNFAILPEYIENENIRMYEIQMMNNLIDKKEKIDSLLYIKRPMLIEWQDSVAMIYGLFGSAKALGRRFTKG